MLSEEQAIEKLKKIKEDTIKANECGLSNNDFKEEIEVYDTVLNLMDRLQKESEEKDNKVRKIISRLDNDYKKITETKAKKREHYLDDYTRCRLKAYRTKTREIKKYIEEKYFETKAKKGE